MPERNPQPMDVIRVDGQLHAVVSVTNSAWAQLEPLADVLARAVAVDVDGTPERLYDALVAAGWTPPDGAVQ